MSKRNDVPGAKRDKKVTRRQLAEMNAKLGEQLRKLLGESISLKGKLTGYTKVFVHMAGGEIRVPLDGFQEELKDMALVADPPCEDHPEHFVYRLAPKDEVEAEVNAEIDAEIARRKAEKEETDGTP